MQAGQLLPGIAPEGSTSEACQRQRGLLHLTLHALAGFSHAIQDFDGDTSFLPSAFTTSKVRVHNRLYALFGRLNDWKQLHAPVTVFCIY